MTDKELLELAAKAAGIKLEFRSLLWTEGTDYPCYEDTESVCEAPQYIPVVRWNPLVDDGDAFRLAVKLGIAVQPYPIYSAPKHSVMARRYQCSSLLRDAAHPDVVELYGDDQDAATRRAIVRAAAEIGKGMK